MLGNLYVGASTEVCVAPTEKVPSLRTVRVINHVQLSPAMLESDQDFKTSFFMLYSSAVNYEKFTLLQMVFFKGDYLGARESTSIRTFQMG
jgi:hypothetical protein